MKTSNWPVSKGWEDTSENYVNVRNALAFPVWWTVMH